MTKKPVRSPTDAKKPLKKQKGSARKATLPKNKRSYKNRLKIEPGGPRMEPGCTKSGAKIKKMRRIAQSGYQMAPKTPLPGTTRRFLAIFGYPLGSQKSTKIDMFPKKPSQGVLFHRFLLRMSFSSIFRLIFSRFWMKNQ